MKILFDTNVILDALTERQPFYEDSKKALACIALDGIEGAITANTITDLYYLYRKRQPDPQRRKDALLGIVTYLEVLDTTRDLCLRAFVSPVIDFEDALLAESAKLWSADFIVTRDFEGFSASPVKAIPPDELLRKLRS